MSHAPDSLTKAPETAHRRRDSIARAQVILPIIAVLGVATFWLAQWLWHADARYSPGPLARVHSQWDNECAACHVTSMPLASHNWLANLSKQTHVADAKCQSCHAGPSHHANQKDTAGCTACHREHLGSPGHLLAVNDSLCTSCHQNLDDHRDGPPSAKIDPHVTAFIAGQHPEFKAVSEKKDPGTIAFNHALHMTPGLRDADGGSVTLDCRSCHRTDAQDLAELKDSGLPASSLRPARGSGATMAPIVYEQHCQSCHPLTIDRKIPGDKSSGLLTVRHRQQPREALDALKLHYTNLALTGAWTPKPGEAPKITLPGKPAERKALSEKIDADAHAALLGLMLEKKGEQLEKQLLGHQTTCQKCHASIDPSKGVDQTIPPAAIPTIWMKSARFDHTSHRALDCRSCHPRAYPGTAESATTKDAVMLPSAKVCFECHAPASGWGDQAKGGARFDCIGCHTYHHGEAPLAGRGSKARQPAGTKTIGDFLEGK